MASKSNLRGGGRAKFTDQLYDALQYSGLITQGMTHEEMCVALAAEYPEFDDYIYRSGQPLWSNWRNNIRYGTGTAEGTASVSTSNITLTTGNTQNSDRGALAIKAIDLTEYNSVQVVGSFGNVSLNIRNLSGKYYPCVWVRQWQPHPGNYYYFSTGYFGFSSSDSNPFGGFIATYVGLFEVQYSPVTRTISEIKLLR